MVEAKVPVSMRALVQRINRKLAQSEEVLKKTRGARARLDMGEYYILDWRRNIAPARYVDPEALAQELGVLEAWEYVREEED